MVFLMFFSLIVVDFLELLRCPSQKAFFRGSLRIFFSPRLLAGTCHALSAFIAALYLLPLTFGDDHFPIDRDIFGMGSNMSSTPA